MPRRPDTRDRRGRKQTRRGICPACGVEFSYPGGTGRRYCTPACRWRRAELPPPDSSHAAYKRRAQTAPGLSQRKRERLLARWKAAGRRCSYCPRLADTVDHVLPLVRGGTNWEGNLAPACRSCNSARGTRLLVEWRFRRGGGPGRHCEARGTVRNAALPSAGRVRPGAASGRDRVRNAEGPGPDRRDREGATGDPRGIDEGPGR